MEFISEALSKSSMTLGLLGTWFGIVAGSRVCGLLKEKSAEIKLGFGRKLLETKLRLLTGRDVDWEW